MTAGYSGTSLIKKLGINPGFRVALLNPPPGYHALLEELPADVTTLDTLDGVFDLIQFFTSEQAALAEHFPALKKALKPAGMLWVSWPKKAAKLPTDLNENIIRDIGLQNGLVDVKVIAVDEKWSGLKFVYRVKDRK